MNNTLSRTTKTTSITTIHFILQVVKARISSLLGHLSATEILIKVVKDGAATLKPRFIRLMSRCQPI